MPSSPMLRACLAALCLACATAQAAPDPAAIDRWIGQLGAREFSDREAATRSLVAVGRPVLEPLRQAIGAGDLEVASRGIEIITVLLQAADPELSAAAEQTLDALVAEGGGPAARMANDVLEFHRVGQAEEARAALEELGAVFWERTLNADFVGLDVEVPSAWRGGSADLRKLANIRGLVAVAVHGVRLDDDAVAVLGRLRSLRRLDLFGTGLAEEAVQALAAALPDTVIDVRRGGRLGVGSTAFAGPCEITQVSPGSAADKAGVRVGDTVVAVDGEAIPGFERLTALVARHAPGDRLALTIARPAADGGAERVEIVVALDAW